MGQLSSKPRGARVLHAIAIAIACSFAATAAAQETGPLPRGEVELQRQRERERQLRQEYERTPDVHLQRGEAIQTPARLPQHEAPCFRVRELALSGADAQRWDWLVAAANPADDPVVGTCAGTQAIQITAARMQNALIARGFVTTRVLTPSQNLLGGALTFEVLPGRVRAIRMTEDSSSRATPWTAIPIRAGDVLNVRDLEQALENFKRVPTAEADIQIAPAEGADAHPGDSDVVVRWTQRSPLRVALSADNSGSKATGVYQGSLSFSYDHPLTLNDILYVSLNQDLGGGAGGDQGTRGNSVHYSVPYGYWLLSLTAIAYSYHQTVAGASQLYVYSGRSRNQDVRLSRLLHRDAASKTAAHVRGWLRESASFIDDTEIEVQRRRMAGWELGLMHQRTIGSTTFDASVALRRGTGARGALAAPEEAFGEGTSRLQLITADAQLQAPFHLGEQRLRYGAAWRAQWNRTPLVPQDRLAIGGRYTVRGFDGELTLAGERGWVLRNELGWALPAPMELYLAVDVGHVGGPSTRFLEGRTLAGAGVGLRGSAAGFAWDLFAGVPLYHPEQFQAAQRSLAFSVSYSF